MENKILAICIKSYPDEDDMRSYCDEEITLDEVKIYYKGRKYWVSKGYDEKYYKLFEKK